VSTPDGKGYFLSITVSDKVISGVPTSYSLPISNGELKVVQEIMSYSIPRFLGFQHVWNNNDVYDPIAPPPVPPDAPVWKKLN